MKCRTIIFGGRIALSSISHPVLWKWSKEQKQELEKELTRDGLRLMTSQLIEVRKATYSTPSLDGRSEKMTDQLGSKSGPEAKHFEQSHYLFARAFVSAWDKKNARAFDGTALFFGGIA